MNTLELSQEQIDLKRRLDEAAEKEEIKSFDEQIESLDKLSFSEAKRLYEIANNSDFDSIREFGQLESGKELNEPYALFARIDKEKFLEELNK